MVKAVNPVELDRRRLSVALVLILGYMAAEVALGFASHSLALLSDAAHMLTDAAALVLSLVAMRLAVRPPAAGLTYGLKRAEILSALANGTALLALSAIVVYEAVRRLMTPLTVRGWTVLVVALAGVGVNLVATWQIAKADRESLNIKAAFQHIATDLFAFTGTAVAAGVILATGFQRADPIASLLVAVLMLRTSMTLIRATGRVLLEAAPSGMSIPGIGGALADHPDVTDVHDLHVWEITSGFPALSAHILVRAGQDCHQVRRDLEVMLGERFGIDHTTLQVDHDDQGRQLTITRNRPTPEAAGS